MYSPNPSLAFANLAHYGCIGNMKIRELAGEDRRNFTSEDGAEGNARSVTEVWSASWTAGLYASVGASYRATVRIVLADDLLLGNAAGNLDSTVDMDYRLGCPVGGSHIRVNSVFHVQSLCNKYVELFLGVEILLDEVDNATAESNGLELRDFWISFNLFNCVDILLGFIDWRRNGVGAVDMVGITNVDPGYHRHADNFLRVQVRAYLAAAVECSLHGDVRAGRSGVGSPGASVDLPLFSLQLDWLSAMHSP